MHIATRQGPAVHASRSRSKSKRRPQLRHIEHVVHGSDTIAESQSRRKNKLQTKLQDVNNLAPDVDTVEDHLQSQEFSNSQEDVALGLISEEVQPQTKV